MCHCAGGGATSTSIMKKTKSEKGKRMPMQHMVFIGLVSGVVIGYGAMGLALPFTFTYSTSRIEFCVRHIYMLYSTNYRYRLTASLVESKVYFTIHLKMSMRLVGWLTPPF